MISFPQHRAHGSRRHAPTAGPVTSRANCDCHLKPPFPAVPDPPAPPPARSPVPFRPRPSDPPPRHPSRPESDAKANLSTLSSLSIAALSGWACSLVVLVVYDQPEPGRAEGGGAHLAAHRADEDDHALL